MINTISWDVDECILHSMIPVRELEQDHKVIDLGEEQYFTVLHPKAKELIEYSRNLVGKENVYILTLGKRHYAFELNKIFELGFPPENIRAREDWSHPIRVGYGYQYPTHEKWSRNNILIDNLPMIENRGKCDYLGINEPKNYLKVRDFYGIVRPNDNFYQNVIDFINERYNG